MDRFSFERIKLLLHKHLEGSLTASEAEELNVWASSAPENRILLQRISDPDQLSEYIQLLQESKANIFSRLKSAIPELAEEDTTPVIVHRVHFLRRGFLKYAAAVILIAAAAGWLWFSAGNRKKDNAEIVKTSDHPIQDIPAGGNKAILTLADGSSIVLDSAGNGLIAQQGATSIEKLSNGQIRYNNTGTPVTGMYNTMRTPRGGQYQLTLPDGTRAWLNAASSISYPVAFSESERKVKISGEVYFETVKDAAKPFLVDIDSRSTVRVLGTSFNINAYSNESLITTTLLDGAVQVQSAAQHILLKPGQQSLQTETGSIDINTNADVERAIAWKNGRFDFNGLDLAAIVRQLERWYDIETEFNGPISKEIFKGRLTRDLSLTQVLEILGRMDIKYKIEGRKLILY